MSSSQSLTDHEADVENGTPQHKQPLQQLCFLDRLQHFTWAWYMYPMATGGLTLLLAPETQPHDFPGLRTIGKVVYIYDLIIFSLVTFAMIYRFRRWPETFKASLIHPTESLFLATFLLSMASIIASIARYGIPACGPWLVRTYYVLFWIYFAVTFAVAVGQYCVLFTNPLLKIQDMTPAWDLPIFPFMLSGTIAGTGAALQPNEDAIPMIIGGLTAQGLGMIVSILMYSSYFRRMIQFGFPSPNSRPGMFIAVGPPSFTALALIGMAEAFPDGGYDYFGNFEVTRQVLRILATMTAIFIWSLAFWFFCISVISNIAIRKQLSFHLNWWAFVFPNVGFIIAIINIGRQLKSQGILWLGSVLTVLMVVLYLFVLINLIWAVYKKDILWPGKDEDNYTTEKKGKVDRIGLSGKYEQKEKDVKPE